MEKSNEAIIRHAERMNTFFKNNGVRIICYILAFLAINVYFGNLYYQSRTLTAEELTTQTITVDKIRYVKTKGTRFWIVADNMELDISTSDLRVHKLNVNSFRDKVAEGDQLVVSYFKISPFSDQLYIVEAFNDNGVYLTLEGHNSDLIEPRVMALIFYFLATCVYSFVMITTEGWFMQWIRKRNAAREKNKRAKES